MDRVLDVVTSRPLATLPRVERLAWERAGRGYLHQAWRRQVCNVAVQVTVAGQGWMWPGADGGRGVPLPVGTALVFISGDGPQGSRLRYGLGPSPLWEFAYANLAGEAAVAVAGELIARRGHALPLPADHPSVRALLHRLPAQGASAVSLDAATSARIAWDLLTVLGEEAAADPEATLAAGAMAYLRRRLADEVGVAEAASHLGVSREHLTRVFHAHAGVPPAAWLRRLRLEHAERLLRTGPLAVGAVARRCGFRSVSHFIKAFQAHAGSTPAGFRMG